MKDNYNPLQGDWASWTREIQKHRKKVLKEVCKEIKRREQRSS